MIQVHASTYFFEFSDVKRHSAKAHAKGSKTCISAGTPKSAEGAAVRKVKESASHQESASHLYHCPDRFRAEGCEALSLLTIIFIALRNAGKIRNMSQHVLGSPYVT